MALLMLGMLSCDRPNPYAVGPACGGAQIGTAQLGGCGALAAQGSAPAMALLGDYYAARANYPQAYDWYRQAADHGHLPTLRKLYDDYKSGGNVPRNDTLAQQFLHRAAQLKAQWALLVLARQAETGDPVGALAAYQDLARQNNCFAQARLASAYFRGDLAPRNLTQGYFWSLLATAAADSRHSDYHWDADLFSTLTAPPSPVPDLTCQNARSITPLYQTESALPPDRRQLAQDAATAWLPGAAAPNLPPPDGTPVAAAASPGPAPALPPPEDNAFPAPDPNRLHGRPAPHTVMVVVGIDQYENAPRASFAERDAAVFATFARTALGISDDNLKVLTGRNARRLDWERALTTWLPSRLHAGNGTVLVYFAGHGIPNDDGTRLYLMPYDGDREVLDQSAMGRDTLIERLQAAGASHVTLILDTCFAGLNRDGDSLTADARPIAIVPKAAKAGENVTILSAAQGTQLSLALKAAGHGLYSYMLLKGLEGAADSNNDHRITAQELHAYAADQVNRQATQMGHKQNPVLDGDGTTVLVQW